MSKDLNNEEKLEEIYQMTIENNHVLRGIRRQHYISNGFSLLYWMLVLGALGSAYYFIGPVVSSFTDKTKTFEETMVQFNQLKSQLPEAKMLDKIMKGVNQNGLTGSAPLDANVEVGKTISTPTQ